MRSASTPSTPLDCAVFQERWGLLASDFTTFYDRPSAVAEVWSADRREQPKP